MVKDNLVLYLEIDISWRMRNACRLTKFVAYFLSMEGHYAPLLNPLSFFTTK